MKTLIEKSTFDFLKKLKRNNDREWFQENKNLYLEAQSNVHAWIDQLLHEMNKHDRLQTASAKESLYRIYNDVRFSKDKSFTTEAPSRQAATKNHTTDEH